MGREKSIVLPSIRNILSILGENIRLARLRRQLSTIMVAQRAGISRNTLRAVEEGNPNVTLGAYVNVLHSLGLEKDLQFVAQDDELGRKLQDAGLNRKSSRRSQKSKKDE